MQARVVEVARARRAHAVLGDGGNDLKLLAAIGVYKSATGRRIAAQHEHLFALGVTHMRLAEQTAVSAGHDLVGHDLDVAPLGFLLGQKGRNACWHFVWVVHDDS